MFVKWWLVVMALEFNEIERAFFEVQLCDNNPIHNQLIRQIEKSTVVSRNMTGVGFYTEIQLLDNSLSLQSSDNFELGDVECQVPELKNGLGFVLFVKDGQLAALEGYTFDETWPNNDFSFCVLNRLSKTEKKGHFSLGQTKGTQLNIADEY